MENYLKSAELTAQEQGVDVAAGLASAEAAERLEKYGRNAFEKQKKRSLLSQILGQLKDVSTIILIIAAVLSLVMSILEWEGPQSLIEPLVIIVIIIMNVILAVTQERSAENALDALSSLASPICRVIRGGNVQELNPEELVPGDIILLKTGDLVPADARLIRSESLAVDESSLTGESVPAEKDASAVFDGEVPLGDRANCVFSGCLVTAGNASAIVTGTGMDTEIGKIARFLTETKQQKTTLQMRLDKVGKVISGLAIMSAIIMFVVGFFVYKHELMHMIMIAVTLAVAAVPETLSLIVTLILAQGAKKMASKNALVRQMQAVETLGSTSVICSDKTGTLTMNKMTVKRLWVYGGEPVSEEANFTDGQMDFLEKLCLACVATVGTDDDGSLKIFGDPTESAIVRLALNKGIDYPALQKSYEKVAEIPFSSARKMMTAVYKNEEGGYLVLTKGAFDRLPFDRSDLNYMKPLTDTHDSFASDALRVISLSYKLIDRLPADISELESGQTFAGFVGIIDPPRPEAAAAIAKAKAAGIRTIMITGDHAATAAAIARELGIIAAGEGVITGQELSKLTDEELNDSIEFYSVYARVSPEDKIRIVKAWQSRGEVVAMTGDGVNDAPALKAADVGVAMGINGTEVSKSAAKMILTDDKFSTIIEAVGEGRNIFSNIRKLVYFLLVCNISEIVVMLFAQFINWELPLTPIMLLIINVLGDGIPGLALSKEESDKRIMKRKPIARNESFFGGGLMEVIIQQIFAFAAVTLVGYYIGMHVDFGGGENSLAAGRTMAFLITGWTSILHVLTVRSRSMLYKYKVKDNPQLYISCAVMIIVFALIAAITPIAEALEMTALSWQQWLITIGLSLVPIIVAEYGKLWDAIKSRNIEKTRVSYR
ncbi:MAG TPA: calcium-translocating P-type ATPase, PMCA-type [Candidatus Coproplasma excrementipullorum]|nr:calcium-translocating P-type ATPase, PMCA-type [Candidatus Coproplasma excrementipullorum]